MLFRGIDTYLNRYTPARVTPHLQLYIDILNTQRELVTSRYLNAAGAETPLVVILRKILADADIPNLMKHATDMDCYADVLTYTASDLNAIFDANETGLVFHDLLMRRHATPIAEYLIPVQCQDPISMLPMDLGWDAWQEIRALRLVDIDSLELNFNAISGQLLFINDVPSRVVLTIDVVALVLQYVNFLRYVSPTLGQVDYCHHYVLVHILQDLQDLWITNVYSTVIAQFDATHPDMQSIIVPRGDGFYGYKGAQFKVAMQELVMMIQTCHHNAMPPATLIASLPLSDTTIPPHLMQLLTTTTIENVKQYQWMEYLRDARWMQLIYDTYKLQPHMNATENLMRALRRDIPILNAQRPWSNSHDKKTSQFIETAFKQWLARIQLHPKTV